MPFLSLAPTIPKSRLRPCLPKEGSSKGRGSLPPGQRNGHDGLPWVNRPMLCLTREKLWICRVPQLPNEALRGNPSQPGCVGRLGAYEQCIHFPSPVAVKTMAQWRKQLPLIGICCHCWRFGERYTWLNYGLWSSAQQRWSRSTCEG
jgi:hypothetical protein